MTNLLKIYDQKVNVTKYPFKSNLEDFYLSNSFTKASSIMGQCSQLNRKNNTNFF